MHVTTIPSHGRLLRRALLANAVFSMASGLLLLSPLSAPIARWLGQGWTVALGLGLLAFALTVAREARQAPIARSAAVAISMADLGWVLATSLLLWLHPASAEPTTATILTNLVVTSFALTQLLALRGAAPPSAG